MKQADVQLGIPAPEGYYFEVVLEPASTIYREGEYALLLKKKSSPPSLYEDRLPLASEREGLRTPAVKVVAGELLIRFRRRAEARALTGTHGLDT
jgi:hypothetical protein